MSEVTDIPSHWNMRVVIHRVDHPDTGNDMMYTAIHEVHYKLDEIVEWSLNPIVLVAEDEPKLRHYYDLIAAAFSRPPLYTWNKHYPDKMFDHPPKAPFKLKVVK